MKILIQKRLKYPSETFPIACDFSNVLEVSESILSGSSAATAFTGSNWDYNYTEFIVSDSLAVSGSRLVVEVQSGSLGEEVQLQFKAVSDLGNTYIQNGYFQIVGE